MEWILLLLSLELLTGCSGPVSDEVREPEARDRCSHHPCEEQDAPVTCCLQQHGSPEGELVEGEGAICLALTQGVSGLECEGYDQGDFWAVLMIQHNECDVPYHVSGVYLNFSLVGEFISQGTFSGSTTRETCGGPSLVPGD
jgi:hypothetical protein